MTPLYKSLKKNGTSVYCFPSASEDLNAAYNNPNYKMYFSKFVLLNLPKQNILPVIASQSQNVYFDFDVFKKSNTYSTPTNYADQVVESLRNYVANQEVVIKESRTNNTDYYYNPNTLMTSTEKIFWKWCKKLGIIDFELAIPNDEYTESTIEFQSNNVNSKEYFPEYLWKEREIYVYKTFELYESAEADFIGKLEITFETITNFKVGDIVNIHSFPENSFLGYPELIGFETSGGLTSKVLKVVEPQTPADTQKIILDIDTIYSMTNNVPTGKIELVYNRLVQYIGEISGVSNVQEANRSYTEVYAHIPDHTGMTPDILFRTRYDYSGSTITNYKPGMEFPIIPNQYQPEIMGAELFNSPIVSDPANYPGSYYGQFDTENFTYLTSDGDILRRSGDYFGISGTTDSKIVNSSKIDGLSLDFNTNHYVKMNLPNKKISNFDQFNSGVDGKPPRDFEFNAILWYYNVEDNNGNTATNLYGITFLDNPDNNIIESEIGLRFPTYKKLVANGEQDGISYAFNLNLNFNVTNDNPQEAYNPESINSLFSMNLFNKAMQGLSSTNDSFLNLLAEQTNIKNQIIALQGLLYTQTDLSTINNKIKNLEDLLRLYTTAQLKSSETISVTNMLGTPPQILLENIDTVYNRIDVAKTTDLYNANGIIPMNLPVPTNKNWLVYIKNDDIVSMTIPNNNNLSLILSRDLDYKQTAEFYITAEQAATENKKLDIFLINNNKQVLLVGGIDLPVYYNNTISPNRQNYNYNWKEFNFELDFNSDFNVHNSGKTIDVPFKDAYNLLDNSIKPGDVLNINNLAIGTSSYTDYSGQYKVLGSTSSVKVISNKNYISFDVSSNSQLSSYLNSNQITSIHNNSSTYLANKPFIGLNKGKKILVTRILNDSTDFKTMYKIDIFDL